MIQTLRKHLFLILLVTAAVLPRPLFSQEAPAAEEAETRHVITAFHLKIEGRTSEKALRSRFDLDRPYEFKSRQEVQDFLADMQQKMMNLRLFKTVEYASRGTQSSEELMEYQVAFIIEDLFPILGIAYPKYDSNEGFRLAGKFYYDNLGGTLINLYTGAGFYYDFFNQELTQWDLALKLEEIYLFDQTFDVSFTQKFDTTSRENSSGTTILKYSNYTTGMSLSWSPPLPVFENLGYTMTPSVSFNYGYTVDTGSVDMDTLGTPNLGFSHSIGFSDIDWLRNFRRGWSLSLSNGYSLQPTAQPDYSISIAAEGSFFIPWEFLNLSAKGEAFYIWSGEKNSAGSGLRGVQDDRLYGNTGYFINSSLDIRTLHIKGFGAFHFQPFFDIGAVYNLESTNTDYNPLQYGTGIDFIFHADFTKAALVRLTVGANLTDQRPWNDFDKYEIILTSSLFY